VSLSFQHPIFLRGLDALTLLPFSSHFLPLSLPFSPFSLPFSLSRRGLSSGLVGVAVSNGIFYLSYEWLKSSWEGSLPKGAKTTTLQNLALGALAGSMFFFNSSCSLKAPEFLFFFFTFSFFFFLLLLLSLLGTITAVGTNPIWVVNTRMSVKGNSHSTLEKALVMLKEEGSSGRSFFLSFPPIA